MSRKSKALFIVDKLNKNGFEAYLVGGCVRDILLSKKPNDYDIATNAFPNEIIEIFSGYEILKKGNEFGTIPIVIDKEIFEVTTFRVELDYLDSRHPERVQYVNSIEEDLARRDFTINAIAMRLDGSIIDPFNGQRDLANKLIKCVGNPINRFSEDGLRILRALRFSSVLGFNIERYTKAAIFEQAHRLKFISSERIQEEFVKILNGKDVLKILMEYKNVFSIFIPEFIPLFGFNQKSIYHAYDIWEHSARVVSNCSNINPMLRVAAIFHDIGKPECYTEEEGKGHFYGHPEISTSITNKILNELRFKKNDIELVSLLVSNHNINFYNTKKFILKMLNKINEDAFRLLIQLKFADVLNHAHSEKQVELLSELIGIEDTLEEIKKEKLCFKIKDLAINGNDLIAIGFKQGKEIGDVLKIIFEKVLEQELENKKEILLQEALII